MCLCRYLFACVCGVCGVCVCVLRKLEVLRQRETVTRFTEFLMNLIASGVSVGKANNCNEKKVSQFQLRFVHLN
jgi:hypothetical protein